MKFIKQIICLTAFFGVPAAAAAQNELQFVPPVAVLLEPVGIERGLDEFEATCLAPNFDLELTQEAVRKSQLIYYAEPMFEDPVVREQRWNSEQAILTLQLPVDAGRDGAQLPRCGANMVTDVRQPPQLILDQIRSRIVRYFPAAEIADGTNPYSLAWRGDGDISYEVDLIAIVDDGMTDDLQITIVRLSEEGRRMEAWVRCKLQEQDQC